MNMQEGWPESVFVDEESAEEAVRQLQEEDPDGFFKIVFSDMCRFVDIGEVEEDDWL